MTDYTVCEIALPDAGDLTPSWVAAQTDEIFRADAVATLGNEDFFQTTIRRAPGYRDQSDVFVVALVAVTGIATDPLPRGRVGLPALSWDARVAGTDAPVSGADAQAAQVVGTASVHIGVTDNTHRAEVGVIVREDHRRHGIGRALIETCEGIARERGCRSAQGWAEHRPLRPGEEPLVPPTGAGAVAPDEPTLFARALGYELEQVERHSVLELPIPEEKAASLRAEAEAKAAGYTPRTYLGAVPEDIVEGYYAMMAHFSTEAPQAGLDVEAEVWDPERIRRREAEAAERGDLRIATVVLHDATGDVVAVSNIDTNPAQPEVAFQQVTVVDSRHRGHRLGLLAKVLNAVETSRAYPEVRRVHTWNAFENEHMIAVNDAAGFAERLVEGAWQKRLQSS